MRRAAESFGGDTMARTLRQHHGAAGVGGIKDAAMDGKRP